MDRALATRVHRKKVNAICSRDLFHKWNVFLFLISFFAVIYILFSISNPWSPPFGPESDRLPCLLAEMKKKAQAGSGPVLRKETKKMDAMCCHLVILLCTFSQPSSSLPVTALFYKLRRIGSRCAHRRAKICNSKPFRVFRSKVVC